MTTYVPLRGRLPWGFCWAVVVARAGRCGHGGPGAAMKAPARTRRSSGVRLERNGESIRHAVTDVRTTGPSGRRAT